MVRDGHVVQDHGDSGRIRDGAEMRLEAGLHRLVVVGTTEGSRRPRGFRFLAERDRVRGRVRAGAGDRRHPAARNVHGEPDQLLGLYPARPPLRPRRRPRTSTSALDRRPPAIWRSQKRSNASQSILPSPVNGVGIAGAYPDSLETCRPMASMGLLHRLRQHGDKSDGLLAVKKKRSRAASCSIDGGGGVFSAGRLDVELEDAGDQSDRLRPFAGLVHGEADGFVAIDEQPSAQTAFILDDPMAATVSCRPGKYWQVRRPPEREARIAWLGSRQAPWCVAGRSASADDREIVIGLRPQPIPVEIELGFKPRLVDARFGDQRGEPEERRPDAGENLAGQPWRRNGRRRGSSQRRKREQSLDILL